MLTSMTVPATGEVMVARSSASCALVVAACALATWAPSEASCSAVAGAVLVE
jgi:hypothetical protein